MSENTKATINAANGTSIVFKPSGINLDWGKVQNAQAKIDQFSSMALVFESEGAKGSASGTSGWAKWENADDAKSWIQVNFDSPFSAANSASIQSSAVFNTLFKATMFPNPVDPDGNCIVNLTIAAIK